MTTVQLQVAEPLAVGRVRLANGTMIYSKNYAGCAVRRHCEGHAPFGCCRSKSRFALGMQKGVPDGYDLVDPKTGAVREVTSSLTQATRTARCSASGPPLIYLVAGLTHPRPSPHTKRQGGLHRETHPSPTLVIHVLESTTLGARIVRQAL